MKNHTNNSSVFIIGLCRTVQFLSLMIFAYISGVQTLGLFSLERGVDPRIFEYPYLRMLVMYALGAAIISALLLANHKKQPYISFFELSLSNKISTGFMIISFAYFFTVTRADPSIQELLIFVGILLPLILVIPTTLNSYTGFNVADLIVGASRYIRKISGQLTFPNRSKQKRHTATATIFSSFLLAAVVTFLGLVLSGIIGDYLNGTVSNEKNIRNTVYIDTATPPTTTQAEKIILQGYNLGWGNKESYKIKTSRGTIENGVWTNDKIIFEVPLSVPNGPLQIWIEKPRDDEEKNSKIVKSNTVSVVIADRFDYYPTASDNVFVRQWKKIRRFIYLK